MSAAALAELAQLRAENTALRLHNATLLRDLAQLRGKLNKTYVSRARIHSELRRLTGRSEFPPPASQPYGNV